jgi:hypothetical protein
MSRTPERRERVCFSRDFPTAATPSNQSGIDDLGVSTSYGHHLRFVKIARDSREQLADT